jgi:hypothetical protein
MAAPSRQEQALRISTEQGFFELTAGVLVQLRDWSTAKHGGGHTWAELQGHVVRIRRRSGRWRLEIELLVPNKRGKRKRSAWLDEVTYVQRGQEVRLLKVEHWTGKPSKEPRIRLSGLAERLPRRATSVACRD